MSKITGGYILLSRKIIESSIWDKPPLYIKVWVWLLSKAQHSNYKQLKRGQLFVKIEDIQNGVSWHVGYRKATPTKDQIYQIIEWMRKCCEGVHESNDTTTMIATTKATHGLLINIVKYDFYQTSENYEGNNESTNETETKQAREQRQPDNINKNVKNDKNNKNVINICGVNPPTTKFIPPTFEEVKVYCLERKNNVDPDKWFNHYSANGWKVGQNKMKDWKAAVRKWEGSEIKHQDQYKKYNPSSGNIFLEILKEEGKA